MCRRRLGKEMKEYPKLKIVNDRDNEFHECVLRTDGSRKIARTRMTRRGEEAVAKGTGMQA